MKRTASMSLDWEELGSDKEGWHQYWSLLPDIPGYPYADGFDGAVLVADHSDDGDDGPFVDGVYPEETDWDFSMSLGLVDGDASLTNEDFGIPDTETADEMKRAVESLSIEDIADALQAKGYMPNVDVTAARKADKRTAHFDLDWKKYVYQTGLQYDADFPSIPGYTAPGYMTEAIVDTPTVDLNDVYSFTLMLGGINDGRMSTLSTVQLHSDDFGIPYRDTPKEAMQDLENLSMDDIIFVLQQEGCQPYEED